MLVTCDFREVGQGPKRSVNAPSAIRHIEHHAGDNYLVGLIAESRAHCVCDAFCLTLAAFAVKNAFWRINFMTTGILAGTTLCPPA